MKCGGRRVEERLKAEPRHRRDHNRRVDAFVAHPHAAHAIGVDHDLGRCVHADLAPSLRKPPPGGLRIELVEGHRRQDQRRGRGIGAEHPLEHANETCRFGLID
jgi:hypothetical protein